MDAEGRISPYGNRYLSKVDVWLAAILIGAMLITLISLLPVVLVPAAFAAAWWSVVLTLLIWGFVLSLLLPLYYEITPSSLLIRSGWIRREIPLSSIQGVVPSSNPLASPALSLDRLQVNYTQGVLSRSILISPRDKATFLRALAESAGTLELQGDRLVRI